MVATAWVVSGGLKPVAADGANLVVVPLQSSLVQRTTYVLDELLFYSLRKSSNDNFRQLANLLLGYARESTKRAPRTPNSDRALPLVSFCLSRRALLKSVTTSARSLAEASTAEAGALAVDTDTAKKAHILRQWVRSGVAPRRGSQAWISPCGRPHTPYHQGRMAAAFLDAFPHPSLLGPSLEPLLDAAVVAQDAVAAAERSVK